LKKKATKKQTQQVLEGLIGDIQTIFQRMINTENVVRLYIEHKGDVDGFYKFLEDRTKKNEADSKE
jgi:hypothetical protein